MNDASAFTLRRIIECLNRCIMTAGDTDAIVLQILENPASSRAVSAHSGP
jgi:hypothetical protein